MLEYISDRVGPKYTTYASISLKITYYSPKTNLQTVAGVTFRNYSLAYFMSENKCFPPGVDLKKTIDFYQQVSFQLSNLFPT